ncbi:carnosine synthase 1-like [Babylonia areolata]|uniref:carnosine synthase 1-like n=1 Tax=Babylonia areolata TaxID=304850 RepID=UPI003FD453D4
MGVPCEEVYRRVLELRSGEKLGIASSKPVVTGIDAHDCVNHVTRTETMQAQLKGRAVTPATHTMQHGSQRHLLVGKTVVALGAGGESKRQLWTDASKFGVKLVLVESNPQHPSRSVVDTFLHVDYRDHTKDVQHANTVVHLLREHLPDCEVAGCFTWLEDCVPLAAHVGRALGVQHAMSVEAAWNAKSKEMTHTVLSQQGAESSPCLPPALYASPVAKVKTVQEVAEALEKIPLPAVMKLEFGCFAVGVKLVHSIKEAEQHMEILQKVMQNGVDIPGMGHGPGESMILMPRLLGTEHCVDIALYEDEVVAAFIKDKSVTRLPVFSETATVMPSLLSKAASCCRGLGLHTGVYNVDIMMTSLGPRLLEVNARMGGYYLRQWIRLIYNVDLFHLTLMCACGIRPVLSGSSCLEEHQEDSDQSADITQENGKDSDRGYIMGIMLYPSRHAQALATTASPKELQLLDQEGQVIFFQLDADMTSDASSFEKPFGNLAVRASSVAEAKSKLVSVCTKLGLETEESVLEVLSAFV